MTTTVLELSPNRALWEKGDFTKIAETVRSNADAFVASLGVGPGMRVLDLGCGDGTTALPAARLGAEVLGVDIAANLVKAGTERARQQGLSNVRFHRGDAIALDGLVDESFDLVLSMYGAMFAPDPLAVAREMVRVTKPGGRIVMGTWVPGDPTFISQILKISAAFTPPPPAGFISPMLWGDEAVVRDRFVAAGVAPEAVSFERGTWHFRHPGRPAELLAIFRDYYGPTMNAFAAARAAGKEADLQAELEGMFDRENIAQAGTDMPATFLKITVQR